MKNDEMKKMFCPVRNDKCVGTNCMFCYQQTSIGQTEYYCGYNNAEF